MAPEEGRNVRNKLLTITMAVIFMIKMLYIFFVLDNGCLGLTLNLQKQFLIM